MNAYVYQGELLCEGCAKQLINSLDFANKTGAHRILCKDDSNDYPQGPYPDGGGEADLPQYCGICGVFLENPLTEDGEDYVCSQPPREDWVARYPWLYEEE